MSMKTSLDSLRRLPAKAIGRHLRGARPWLCPGSLDPDAQGSPELPVSAPRWDAPPGAAILLYANDRDPILPGLGRGLLLPVQWREGTDHSPRLPSGVLEVARKVLEVTGITGHSLHLSSELEGYDLSELPLLGDSVFVPLAAALIVARSGGKPRMEVFSTGGWDRVGSRVAGVDGYRAKLWAIRQMPGGREASLFVPGDGDARLAQEALDALESESPQGRKVTITPLGAAGKQEGLEQLLMQLAGLLQAFETPPARHEGNFQQRLDYANRPDIQARPRYQLEYVDRCLAEDLGLNSEFRQNGERIARETMVGKRFATVFNPNNLSLLRQLLHALRPAHVTFLYRVSEKTRETVMEQMSQFCEEMQLHGRTTLLELEVGQESRTARQIADFLGTDGLADCTNGNSQLKVTMALGGAGARLLLVERDGPMNFVSSPTIDVLSLAGALPGR
jgi:hypothetical protein